jgi:hypothetical protein
MSTIEYKQNIMEELYNTKIPFTIKILVFVLAEIPINTRLITTFCLMIFTMTRLTKVRWRRQWGTRYHVRIVNRQMARRTRMRWRWHWSYDRLKLISALTWWPRDIDTTDNDRRHEISNVWRWYSWLRMTHS